jgi:hypothetical protein
MRFKHVLSLSLNLLLAPVVFAGGSAGGPPCDALKNTTILIIRHAEKPETGMLLTATGYERARDYVGYFNQFQIDGQPLHLDHLFCTADSKGSQRPRLTITPLSQALKLKPDNRYASKDAPKLAQDIRAQSYGQELLICWHHGEIPHLLQGLGADPGQVLPDGKWPDNVFGWLIELRYDATGRLQETRLIHENLMPDDHVPPAKS